MQTNQRNRKLKASDVSKQTYEKYNYLRLDNLLTFLGEDLGCYTDDEFHNWKINLLDKNSIYDN